MVAWNSTNGEVAVVGGCRTPFSRFGTALGEVHVTDLARSVMTETMYRSVCRFDRPDEVILGNVVMPPDAANPARVAALWAGIPDRTPALTVQRNCASGMEAVAEAALRISAGHHHLVLAGGAESMSQAPLLFNTRGARALTRVARARSMVGKALAATRLRPRHFRPVSGLELGLTDPTCNLIMGKTAEVLAHGFGITRRQQDDYAVVSHQRAVAAAGAGKWGEEIVPIYAGRQFDAVTSDNGPRPQQTMEALSKLKLLFDSKDGTVTAGNSCQLTDGAAAVLVAEADLARSEAWPILGYVRGYAYSGLGPRVMGLGPVFAIDALLSRTGLKLSDIGLFEINEAFAAQVLACVKAMGSTQFAREHLNRNDALGEVDPGRLNVNGGAIALGHPVGATGARLILTLLLEMQRRDVAMGIAALCVGGGQGAAVLLERR